RLRPRLLSELSPGTRIVSHAFDMGDWRADEWIELNGIKIYKWIVPANVAGEWEWDGVDGRLYQVELQQKYQEVSGSAWLEGRPVHLKDATLCGDRLVLEIQEDNVATPHRFALTFVEGELESIVDESE